MTHVQFLDVMIMFWWLGDPNHRELVPIVAVVHQICLSSAPDKV